MKNLKEKVTESVGEGGRRGKRKNRDRINRGMLPFEYFILPGRQTLKKLYGICATQRMTRKCLSESVNHSSRFFYQ